MYAAYDASELGPRNIHVAHLVIDAGVDTAFVRDRIRAARGDEALAALAPDELMRPESIADAVVKACGPEADRLRAAGPERAAQFSWRATAERTLAVYREVYARTSRKAGM